VSDRSDWGDLPDGTTLLRGGPVAAELRESVRTDVASLRDAGRTATLATVLMDDDPAAERFVELKHEACREVGIDVRATSLPVDTPATRLYDAVEDASQCAEIDAVFVQVPLPAGVDESAVRERIDPTKDVDCFHPLNLGRLVDGEASVEPATAGAILALLDAYDVSLAGRDVTIVGRSTVIGRPLANLLFRSPGPDATVTVCHSFTTDLAAKTRGAAAVVTACGVPELVDGEMISPGAVVVDASATRVETDDGYELVGDVAFESAKREASAITPVPGGIGPMTIAMLLRNVVTLAERRV